MNTAIEFVNALLDVMNIMIDARIQRGIAADRTRLASVIQKNESGTYKIKMDGVEYDGIGRLNDSEYTAGNLVMVLIPEGRTSDMIIFGRYNDE